MPYAYLELSLSGFSTASDPGSLTTTGELLNISALDPLLPTLLIATLCLCVLLTIFYYSLVVAWEVFWATRRSPSPLDPSAEVVLTQDLLVARATNWTTYVVPDPEEDCRHEIRIPMYRLSPIVMIQDSKHAAKTMRNNLFSGARALVLGNHLAMYSYVRDMAFSPLPGCPLYHRDVEKLDRQDDNAATRLFSAASLDFVINQFPDRLGLVVYLFVMGEIVDAYQSRTITHLEWVKMVLRCRYFIRLWKRFLSAASYPESRYYISCVSGIWVILTFS